jgi:hypothetical protein
MLCAAPAVIAALPARSSGLSAATLLNRISGSNGVAYSGYAESTGSLALPVTRQFNSIADLFGGHTQMRVWWRGATDWRLDTVTLAGETDVHASAAGTWTWDYESNRAVYIDTTPHQDLRLPAAEDLLPSNLGRRLLSQAMSAEVSSLAARRIAGRSAPGIRLHPAEAATTVDHVDVWADATTGVPMQVAVYGVGDANPVLTTEFLQFSARTPSVADVDFSFPPGARVRTDGRVDLVATIDGLDAPTLPPILAGLPKSNLLRLGSIGVYGRGVTTFDAVPLPDRVAGSLRRQLEDTPGVVTESSGMTISMGPLNLVLSGASDDGVTWLLTGTVRLDTLRSAAAAIRNRP